MTCLKRQQISSHLLKVNAQQRYRDCKFQWKSNAKIIGKILNCLIQILTVWDMYAWLLYQATVGHKGRSKKILNYKKKKETRCNDCMRMRCAEGCQCECHWMKLGWIKKIPIIARFTKPIICNQIALTANMLLWMRTGNEDHTERKIW